MATADQINESIKLRVAEYNRQVVSIREDVTLSPLGRRRRLQELYDTTRDLVAGQRGDLGKASDGGRTALERRLFGLPSGADATDVISYRDAVDRVSAVKGASELGNLMQSADSSGDEILLRAGFARAFAESRNPLASDVYDGLVAEYLDQRPGARRDYEALQAMTDTRLRARGLIDRIAMTVTKPTELSRPESALSDRPPAPPWRPETATRGV